MTINPTLAAAQIERQIRDGTLNPKDANLSDDIRGILQSHSTPNAVTR